MGKMILSVSSDSLVSKLHLLWLGTWVHQLIDALCSDFPTVALCFSRCPVGLIHTALNIVCRRVFMVQAIVLVLFCARRSGCNPTGRLNAPL
jgi:hypothetical protein